MLDNAHSMKFFLPEVILSLGVLAILTADLFAKRPSRMRSFGIALASLLGAGIVTLVTMDGQRRGLFGGLIARDPFSDFFKLLFSATAIFVGIAATRARDAIEYRDVEDKDKESGEFYALLLSITIGMYLMAASTDLLMAFLSLEFVSIVSYIMAGFKRRDRRSSEAALKYVIYGSVAAGVMLYGMSLLYGMSGSTSMATIRAVAATTPATFTLITAVVLCLAGFGYKIAAVPFHMWCPDVYEGAPTPVTAFLAVGPKAAGFALLIRFFGDGSLGGAIPAVLHGEVLNVAPWPLMLALISAATMTLGNLAAIVQTNVKRMLAYSSIAHAGYLILGLCAESPEGEQAILIYLVTYLFMTLGAFLVLMALNDAGQGETIDDFKGIGFRARLPSLVLAVSLFSLTGLPPFAGFFGKLYLFAAVLQKGGSMLTALALIGILNSAISLYYYARLLRAMYFDKPVDGSEEPIKVAPVHAVSMSIMAVASLTLWMVWTPLVNFAHASLAQWVPHVVAPAVQAMLP